jgi:hypothetical protein
MTHKMGWKHEAFPTGDQTKITLKDESIRQPEKGTSKSHTNFAKCSYHVIGNMY